jgi:hypothetical protein
MELAGTTLEVKADLIRVSAERDRLLDEVNWLRNAVAVTVTGHAHVPARGSDVESYLKRMRDERAGLERASGINDVLGDYRERADTGRSLHEPTD